MSLHWPPRDRAEMLRWQAEAGTDLQIAKRLGMSRPGVHGQRTKFDVPALPRKRRKRHREKNPGATLSAYQIAKLYGGRSYSGRGAS